MPEVGPITGDVNGIVDASQNLTISINTSQSDLSDADSIYFAIYDQSGEYILKASPANQTSMLFTAQEMNVHTSGFGYIQANAFTYAVENVGGGTMAFINQGSSTKTITIE